MRRPVFCLVDPSIIDRFEVRALGREGHIDEQHDIPPLREKLRGIFPLILLVRETLVSIGAVRDHNRGVALALHIVARPDDIAGCLGAVPVDPDLRLRPKRSDRLMAGRNRSDPFRRTACDIQADNSRRHDLTLRDAYASVECRDEIAVVEAGLAADHARFPLLDNGEAEARILDGAIARDRAIAVGRPKAAHRPSVADRERKASVISRVAVGQCFHKVACHAKAIR